MSNTKKHGYRAFFSQAMAVIAAPAVAPERPKHATVASVGNASFVFAVTSGDVPVAR